MSEKTASTFARTDMKPITIIALLLFSTLALADDEPPFKEIGFTLGTPAAGNIVLGYWNTEGMPWLVRVEGMDWGSIRGIEGEFGIALQHEGSFKDYLALALTTSYLGDSSGDEFGFTHTLYGAGPVFGLNWYGFSVEAGFVFGTYNETYIPTGATNSLSPVQLTAQLGYTFLWQ